MDKLLNTITASVQALVTLGSSNTSTGASGSAVVDMSKHANVVARAHIAKLVDNKGALSASTLSIYECRLTGLTGSLVTASRVGNSLISNSAETILQTEIKATELSPNHRYVYAHLITGTCSDASIIIERGKPRYSHKQ